MKKNYDYTSKLKCIQRFRKIARGAEFIEQDIFGQNVQSNPNLSHCAGYLLPPRSDLCPNCNALMWIEEKSNNSKIKPLFSLCCSKGKVKLPIFMT